MKRNKSNMYNHIKIIRIKNITISRKILQQYIYKYFKNIAVKQEDNILINNKIVVWLD